MVLEQRIVKASFNEADYIKNLSQYGQIINVQFSPFEWSQDVLLIAFKEKILLAHLDLSDNIGVKILKEFPHPSRCSVMSLSPETSLISVPNVVTFCAGGGDKLRVFRSDLMGEHTSKVLLGHKSYINDVAFDPMNKYLISTSDDNTVKVWSVEDNFMLKCTFLLSSAGVNVCWHRSDIGKVLVAEKLGLIKFYNLESETCIFTCDYGKPLSSCHWAPSDNELVASLHSGEILIWELPNRFPLTKSILFAENGGDIKFSPQGEMIAATNSLEGSLKILHVKTQQVKFTASVTLPTKVTWHYRYPLVCIGDDHNLCFWKTAK